MKREIRQQIQRFHLWFDGVIGRVFSQHKALNQIKKEHKKIGLPDFQTYRYSRLSHFENFHYLPIHNQQSPTTCDLKVYQDSLVYTWIKDTLPAGARLLEIGGGNSRIISFLENQYEIWNLDKFEGSGFGPTEVIKNKGYKVIRDYIGTFSQELPDQYFDLVFSISTVEHFSNNQQEIDYIIQDIQRLLKPGGISLHTVDALLYKNRYHVHPLVHEVHSRKLVPFPEVSFEELSQDKDLWLLSPYAYYTRWFHLVKESLQSFGSPFSINILWKKE